MSTNYPKDAFVIINAKTVMAITMYAKQKLVVNYDEIDKTVQFLNKKLKDANIQGRACFDEESIKMIIREDDSFAFSGIGVECVSGWDKIQRIMSFCDLELLYWVFELKDKFKTSKYKSSTKEI